MSLLALCPGCARHVKRAEHACPFCQSPLEAVEGASDAFDEQPARMSRSAILLAGAALVAGCNLTQSANIYGAPPPRAEPDVSQPVAAIYGGPPPVLVAPTPAPADAGAPPTPATNDGGAAPVAAIYGGPPPPVRRHDRSTRSHEPEPTPPHPIAVPAYGAPPPNNRPPM